MLRRLLLTLCVVATVPTTVQADPLVYFRNKQLTVRHFVYGEVLSATRTIGTVNLGYAHGLSEGQEISVIRRLDGELIPVGILRMDKVRAGASLGSFEGELPIQKSDIVLIAARRLDLWSGRTRMDQMAMRTLISDRTRGYDTGTVSLDLVKEVGHDDDQIGRLPLNIYVNPADFDRLKKASATPTLRGAFVPAVTTESAHRASEEDRILAPDQPARDLDNALVRFVRSNLLNTVNVSEEGLNQLASQMSERIDPDDIRNRLQQSNLRIRKLLEP